VSVTEWLDEAAVATWLGVPVSAVLTAVQAGEIPTLRVGGYVRISRDALLRRAALEGCPMGPAPVATASGATPAPVPDGELPVPAGMAWLTDLSPTADFPYKWPDGTLPLHSNALEGVISLYGEEMTIRVGDTVRYGRARRTVFGDGFICEFAETADGAAWASLIKPDGRSTLPLVAPAPPLYRSAHLGNWRAVTGWQKGGHPEAQAVLIGKDDLRSMVHHAVTRWLAKKHLPLAPAA
jgi:excisionase family DNA binding protein